MTNITLNDKVIVGVYSLEYSNFTILIKKNNSLVKCIDVKKDFNRFDYIKFIDKFKLAYSKK